MKTTAALKLALRVSALTVGLLPLAIWPMGFASNAGGEDGPTQSSAPESAPGSGAERIQMRFDWPVGLRGQQRKTQRIGGAPPRSTVEFAVTSDFEVLQEERGARIAFKNPRVEAKPEFSGDPEAQALRALQQASAELLPDIVVSAEGEFLEIPDLQRVQSETEGAMQAILDDAVDTGPNRSMLESLLQNASTEQALRNSAIGDWNAIVGGWAGKDMTIGEVYSYEDEDLIPVLGVVLPIRIEYRIEERVPCTPGDSARACVRLAAQTRPDPGPLRETIERQSGPAGGVPGRELEELDVQTNSELITEPQTLIPHRLQIEHSTRVRVRSSRDETRTHQRFEQMSVTYVYEDR